jgi:hypothetical protein
MSPVGKDTVDWMRDVLEDAVSDVEPAEALDVIKARTRQTRSVRRGWVWGTTGAGLAVAATLAAIALGTSPESQRTHEPPPATQSPTPSVGTPEPTLTADVPVYYLGEVVSQQGEGGETLTDLRLYREWHEVTGVAVGTSSPAEVARAALQEMLTVPPDDPDYSSAWAVGVEVTSVTHDGGVITVDLSGPVQKTNLGAAAADLTVQQLVYTVQGALAFAKDASATDPVWILLDGKPGQDLWGHVDISQPIARAPRLDVQAPIWITSPAEGDQVSSPLTVEGFATAFEGTVSWRITRQGAVADQSSAPAAESGPAFAPFSFQVDLDPGDYVIEVFEASPLDGTPIHTDSKRITVK